MNYTETLEFIHQTPKFARILGNDMLKKLLGFMGNPQNGLVCIHIAGTNGKGSAAKMLSEIFTRSGYRTGMFTSPYIERFNERIQINNNQISDSDLAEITTYVRRIMEDNNAPVSEFALDTAIAFKYFADSGTDIVILETGLGGRIDATNVIEKSELDIIMHISYDHMQYLGDTLPEIAAEKCGIIKKNSDVVVYPEQESEVWDVIEDFCKKQGARLYRASSAIASPLGFFYDGSEYELSLKGAYQPNNAAAVLEVVKILQNKGWILPDSAIRSALADVSWQARFELIADDIILDGGHNIDGICALKKSLEQLGKPVVLVVAMMADKSIDDCAAVLSQITDNIIATEIDMPRCMSAAELSEKFPHCQVCPNPEAAIARAREINTGVICVCGSLYLCGEVRRLINGI